MRRRIRVTVTKIRRLSFAPQSQPPHGPCLTCAREVELLSMRQAAETLEVGLTALGALISEGHVHAVETVSGSVRVCKDSLFARNSSAKA